MTKDVIELAREACGAGAEDPLQDGGMLMLSIGEMQRLAALVAARERERCALIALNEPRVWEAHAKSPQQRIASAIRALNTEGDVDDRP